MNPTILRTYRDHLEHIGDASPPAVLTFAETMQPQACTESRDLLTVREAAKMLHVSVGTIYALCDSGQLAHHRLGTGRGTIRIAADALKSYHKSTPARRLIR